MTAATTPTRKTSLLLMRVVISMFSAGLIVGAVPQASSAVGSYITSWATFGYHENLAGIDVQTSFAHANTQARYGNVGARGRLFSGYAPGGPMSCEGSNVFSTSWASAWSCTRTTKNSWWAWGVSLSWNGNGYNAYYTYKTPSYNS